ncbi:MAG: ATP-dependent helicase HrpB [Deltaproteobacteria bacterium]|nr:ATP-dependent helicase HrpB [Deltaproteobacteria bacterium]
MRQKFFSDSPELPIDAVLPTLQHTLEQHQFAVLCAPPGSGKTTRVPLSLLDAPWIHDGRIVMLEPRRVAARAVAGFMAQTIGEAVGETVGYQVRMDRRVGADTRLLVVTEGILTRRFLQDPLLENISCVIIDEFHERSVHVDLALCLLREAATVRDDLKVVVMSATINAAEISAYLNGCPIIEATGAPYPLHTVHAKERLDTLFGQQLVQETSATVRRALKENSTGDVLVFLPGASEIERTRKELANGISPDIELVSLYGALSPAKQDDAVRGGEKRRVVLATNIAETSLTIPNVRIVVDSGLEKRVMWQSSVGFEKLVTGRISQFNAIQRAGRAARTAPGTVYRMWHLSQERELPKASSPEITRRDPLATVFMLIAAFCRPPTEIALITPLRQSAVTEAIATLHVLGLVDKEGRSLTAHGKQALQFPIHPRLALIIIAAAQQGSADEGALTAAIIEERPLLVERSSPSQGHAEHCDVQFRIQLLKQFQQRGASAQAASALGLRFSVSRRILDRQQQLVQLANRVAVTNFSQPAPYLLAGFFDRVCQKESANALTGIMANGRGVVLGPATQVRESPFFLALDAVSDTHHSRQRSEVTLASAITKQDLLHHGDQFIRNATELEYDNTTGVAKAFKRTRYMSLIIAEEKLSKVPAHLRQNILFQRAMADWKAVLYASPEQKNALARLSFARHFMPQLNLPAIDDTGLKDIIEESCRNASDMNAIKKIPWASQITALLSYDLQQHLKKKCPIKVPLPSGRSATVDYTRWLDEHTSPIIRVKLQELFGLNDTPVIADGQIPLAIALLAPNGRDVQITTDLKSFWQNTYPTVRKELRARYAKHFWPEDPTDQVATHLTKKQFERKKKQ